MKYTKIEWTFGIIWLTLVLVLLVYVLFFYDENSDWLLNPFLRR